MALTAGMKLGPYEIVAPSGAGGMGEVYRARDTRLGRDVAIKVLPEHFSSNGDLRARFEREARAISSLQHPNICVLHDVGRDEASGTDFLVMEYLEGETLGERLKKGPLPTEQALKTAIEITDALEKAHRQGLVHRDLKPANIMLTKGGAKLMDFGLAKPMAMAAAGSSGAPTFTAMPTAASASPVSPLTTAGTMVGTFQYMSPEQVEGKEADARSDIIAFGAVLYEMITGKRAFEGKSQLSVASAILEKDPEPISAVQPMAPPALDHIVRACLAKDPGDRFQTAHDVGLQLRWVLEGGSRVGVPALVGVRRKTRERVTWALLAVGWLIALAAVALYFSATRAVQDSTRLVRAELLPPESASYMPVQAGAMVLSPDGTRLLFRGIRQGEEAQLWIRDLSSGTARPLAGTEAAIFPFWSPDGRSIGFFSDGKLKKMAAAGGPVQVLADARDGRGGSWSPRGYIVFTPDIYSPLFKVREGGGSPEPVTNLEAEGNRSHRNPHFLPDGKRFLFTNRGATRGEGRLYVGSLDSMEIKSVLERASNAAYSSGYLLFMRDGNLLAGRYDPDTHAFHGDPVALAQDVDYWNPRDLGNFSAAGSVLVYRAATVTNAQLGFAQPGGTGLQTFGEPGRFSGVRVSPDGKRAAVARVEPGGTMDLWLVDLERQGLSRLTFESPIQNTYAFSPDGQRIAIAQNKYEGSKILVRSAVGGPGVEVLVEDPEWLICHDWSRDGRYLIIATQRAETGFDIYYLDLAGKRELIPLVVGAHDQNSARISPNGQWVAYVSNESGRNEVYVVDFPGATRKIQVTSGGGNWPSWSADGRQLFYHMSGQLKSVEVRDPVRMELGAVRDVIMPPDLLDSDLLPGEKRALVLRRAAQGPPSPVQIILNWTRALEE
jgi:Tol biopolymer transport system component/predicted Ser/Thr protein kinase